MPSSEGQAQGQIVIEPIPRDFDNFFAWAQNTDSVEEPVKAALRLIESNHRERFRLVFKREPWPDCERTKDDLENLIRAKREFIEAIEALEDVFTQMPQLNEEYELALVKKDSEPPPLKWREIIILSSAKHEVELDLAALEALEDVFTQRLQIDEEYELAFVRKDSELPALKCGEIIILNNIKRGMELDLADSEKRLLSLLRKTPPSYEAILAGIVANFLDWHEPDMLIHATEIAKLLILHDNKVWPDDEELTKECRAFMANHYGIRIGRRTRTEG